MRAKEAFLFSPCHPVNLKLLIAWSIGIVFPPISCLVSRKQVKTQECIDYASKISPVLVCTCQSSLFDSPLRLAFGLQLS